MSFELKSVFDNSEFDFSGSGWSFCLILAEQFGWIPEGTKRPKSYGISKKWPGNYDSNEGQIVSSSDAEKLSIAIGSALNSPALESKAKEVGLIIENEIKQVFGELFNDYEIQIDINDEFRSYYTEFIKFCKKGGFTIY